MTQFALNHMTVPGLGFEALLALAGSLKCVGVEFRNDLRGALFEGVAPGEVKRVARSAHLRILSLAEIKAFNDWSAQKAQEALSLMAIAHGCGAEGVSLIPRADGKRLAKEDRISDLKRSIDALFPMLEEFDLIGMVEPLGFERSNLRFKEEAVEVIEGLGASHRFKLVHDTFHHALAGGGPVFAGHTGLVHVSGVEDQGPQFAQMRDDHRVLVGPNDRLGNVAQIEDLMTDGFDGPISMEAFSPEVHALDDPKSAINESFVHLTEALAAKAA